MTLSQTLRRLAERYIPTRSRRIVSDSRQEPPSQAALLDVDTLHGILAEAWAGNTARLFATYRDLVLGYAHVQAEFNTRKLAVVGEHPVFEPWDKRDPHCRAAADFISDQWDNYPGGRSAITHLLDSALWPVSLVEKVFRRSPNPRYRYCLGSLRPVPYHLLDYTAGYMRIRDVSPNGQLLGTYHSPDPRRYIIHRGHLMTSIPDNFGGPMKAALFWWLFASMDRDWWIRFLERFGAPFIVGKYDPSDDGARSLLRNAFSAATRLFGLTVSRDTEIEVHSISAGQHSDAFENFHATAARELSKLILGQTMTSEAQSGGIGGTQANVHNAVRGDIRKFDALALADTLRHQLFRQLLDINGYAGVPAPSVSWGSDPADAKALAETIETLSRASLRPTDDALTDISHDLGFPIERYQPTSSLPGITPFSAIPSPLTGSEASELIAQSTARDLAAITRRRIRSALADSTSLDQLTAQFPLPTEADLATQLLIANAANALSQ